MPGQRSSPTVSRRAGVQKAPRHLRPALPMLSTAEIKAELERVTYKPGWVFTCYDGRWEGQHLAITAELPDATRPGESVTLDIHSSLPPIPDAAYLHAWLAWRLGRIENHEMREFFRVDGRAVFDPHAPFADRDLA
jgi:hypothetical protein